MLHRNGGVDNPCRHSLCNEQEERGVRQSDQVEVWAGDWSLVRYVRSNINKARFFYMTRYNRQGIGMKGWRLRNSMERIYVYMYMSDGICHTAMDTNEMNGVEYQLRLLFLELPSPMHTQATSLAR